MTTNANARLLCPCCKKFIKPGINKSKYNIHVKGCEASFGQEKCKSHPLKVKK